MQHEGLFSRMFLARAGVFSAITWVCVSALSATATYKADIYEMGSNRQNKLYTMKVEIQNEGDTTSTVTQYHDLEGNLLFEDKASLKGLQIVKDELSQKQTGATATVEFDGKTAKFVKTENGKTKTETETPKGDFVMSANFQKFVQSKWADLMAGKTVDYRYGVWDRMESVGFSLKKTGEIGEGSEKKVTLLKKPSSFIIAALVNPIEFVFQADGGRMLEMKGRIPPKKKDGSKWKDQDAEVVYSR